MSLDLACSLPQLQSSDSERSTVLPAPSEDDIMNLEIMAVMNKARASNKHILGSFPYQVFPTPSEDDIIEVMALLKKARTSSRRPFASAYDLGDGRYIKVGYSDGLFREAAAMEYIRTHTNIPVPRVQMVFNHNGYGHVVMDAANGNSLASQYEDMSEEELIPIARQLRGYVDELKQLGAGVSTLGSVEAPSSAFQFRFGTLFGNQPIVATLQKAMVEHAHETDVVFSHGDLNAGNIIISSDAPQRIVAIIDWETLGWYPSCWEEMSIWRGVRYNTGSDGWTDAVHSVFGPRQGLTAVYYEVVDALSDDPV
ncbi:kinase-like domain-containing protein [Mycena amicta]|nr:kinase-like domain-containing protein [Mycena amicta]